MALNQDMVGALQQPPPPTGNPNPAMLTDLQQGGGGSLSAFGAGLQHGFKRAWQGLQQIGAHAGISGPEDINPPLPEAAAQAFDARLRASILPEEKALEPVRAAHPWLVGTGDIVGGVAATAPLALAVPGGSLAAMAAQGALVGAAQPALGPDYGKEKLGQVSTGAGLGLLGGAAVNYIPKGIAALWNFPKQFLNTTQERAMATPFAQRGLEVAEQTGMDLSPAMVSGSRVATQAENIARQSMWSADKALESYQKLSQQAVDYADKVTQRWTAGRGAPDAASLGSNLRDVTRNAVGAIHQRAGQQWIQDMERVIQAGQPGFNFSETRDALRKLIQENEHSVTDPGIAIRTKAEELLGRLNAAEQANLKNIAPGTMAELADNAYERAYAKYPDLADKVVADAGGFATIAKDRNALNSVYTQLSGLANRTPTSVLGPRPPAPISLSTRAAQLGGINVKYMPDIIGESSLSPTVRKGLPSNLFSKNGGRSPDDMARALLEEGYLQPGDVMGDDGVRALFRKLGDEVAGRNNYYRPDELTTAAARQQWDEAAARATSAVMPDAMPLPSDVIPIKSAIALRRELGKAAKGTGRIFTDIHPSEDRRMAGQLFGSLNADFESAANNAIGPVGDAFKQANKNYRNAMGSIDYIEESILGKVVGKDVTDALYSGAMTNTAGPPEQVVERIAKLSPSALTQARIILEQHNPQVLQDLKAYTLQRAIDQGETLAPSMGTRITFDPARAAKGLLNSKQRAAIYSPEEAQAIGTFDEALRRWADRHGYNLSGTAPTSEFLQMINKLGKGVIGIIPAAGLAIAGGPMGMMGSAAAAKGTLNYVFGTRQIAEAMLNPGDRMQLLQLLTLPDTHPRLAQLAGALLAKYGAQQGVRENERNNRTRNQ